MVGSSIQINRRSRQTNNLLLLTVLSWIMLAASAQPPSTAGAQYVGSQRCEHCHAAQYAGWKQTRMANVVRSNKATNPDAVLGDFTLADPVRTFDLKQVAFVYGSRWKQRYFARKGDDYYLLPSQWDIRAKRWLPYHVPDGADWWSALPRRQYGAADRPPLRRLSLRQLQHRHQKPTEWNVGCEKCHGPGSEHVAIRPPKNIVNPATLDSVRANDVCLQCHSQGQPTATPSRATTTTGPSDSFPAKDSPTFGTSRNTRSERQTSITGPTTRPTKTECRGTISCRA